MKSVVLVHILNEAVGDSFRAYVLKRYDFICSSAAMEKTLSRRAYLTLIKQPV